MNSDIPSEGSGQGSVPQSPVPIEGDSGGSQERPLVRSHADTGELFRIHLRNYFLTIVTLGIYRFWAKTKMRRYLWSHVSIEGSRLEYTGTAKELFHGFLFVFFLIILPLSFFSNMLDVQLGENKPAWIDGITILLVWFLIGVGFYRARRYRLSRTRWRGIAGGQEGSAAKYGAMLILSLLASAVTFGLAWPACSRSLMRYRLNNARIGDQAVSSNPSLGPLYGCLFKAFLPAAVGAILAGIALFSLIVELDQGVELTAVFGGSLMALGWLTFMSIFVGLTLYKAGELRHFMNHIQFHGLSVKAHYSLWNAFGLVVGNSFIELFTLGLGTPWAIQRVLNFMEKYLSVEGAADFAALLQNQMEKPSYGEGLADAFDIGAV